MIRLPGMQNELYKISEWPRCRTTATVYHKKRYSHECKERTVSIVVVNPPGSDVWVRLSRARALAAVTLYKGGVLSVETRRGRGCLVGTWGTGCVALWSIDPRHVPTAQWEEVKKD